MPHLLAFALAALAVIVVVHLVAEKSGLPAAALLTGAGLCYAALPGPNVVLDPHVVLTFVVPPLLYSAALSSSLLAIRRNLRPVISLSVVLVLVTALAVGAGFALLVPGAGLAVGVALGAAVAPPDPVAALAIGRRVGLPSRLLTLIEGEGLLNDATALTLFVVATAAVTSGDFSFGLAAVRLVLVAAGGLIVGVATAVLVRLARALIADPILLASLSLGTPFAAYLAGEELHVSGVLAVVVCGLMVGHDTPRAVSGASRLQTGAVWRLVDFLLEGFVFLLIGQQLPRVVRGLRAYPTSTILIAAVVCTGAVLLVRPLWLGLTESLLGRITRWPRRRADRRSPGHGGTTYRLTGREVTVLSWAGTRGVITLAAAFSLPLTAHAGAPFPNRDLLIFCSYLVVLTTLIGQGLTFAPLARLVGLRNDFADQARVRNEARSAAAIAGLDRLDQLVRADAVDELSVAAVRTRLDRQLERCRRQLSSGQVGADVDTGDDSTDDAAASAWGSVIDAQRDELISWRDAGRLPDTSLRILQRELDHEEHALPEGDAGAS